MVNDEAIRFAAALHSFSPPNGLGTSSGEGDYLSLAYELPLNSALYRTEFYFFRTVEPRRISHRIPQQRDVARDSSEGLAATSSSSLSRPVAADPGSEHLTSGSPTRSRKTSRSMPESTSA